METIEGNRLIAEFDGWVRKEKSLGGQVGGVWKKEKRLAFGKNAMDYHENWSLLMPVVEKIASHRYEDYETVHDYAFPRTFGMRTEQGMWLVRINRHTLFEEETLIKATWLAVVDFIKSYNSANEARELIATQS